MPVTVIAIMLIVGILFGILVGVLILCMPLLIALFHQRHKYGFNNEKAETNFKYHSPTKMLDYDDDFIHSAKEFK